MSSYLSNCWDIMKCGRQADGDNVKVLGECIASTENMGHSCWIVNKKGCASRRDDINREYLGCESCVVYKMYQPPSRRERITQHCPEEMEKAKKFLI